MVPSECSSHAGFLVLLCNVLSWNASIPMSVTSASFSLMDESLSLKKTCSG